MGYLNPPSKASGIAVALLSNLKFKADFDLGDRITCKETKWGIQIDARITEVTETFQKGEETIEATFGDSLPTLVDQIRKVR